MVVSLLTCNYQNNFAGTLRNGMKPFGIEPKNPITQLPLFSSFAIWYVLGSNLRSRLTFHPKWHLNQAFV